MGGGQGAEYPFHWEIFADLPGKERQGKNGNGQERRKIVKSKVENWKWKGKKVWKQAEDFFFFFFLLFTFGNHWNLFEVYQNGNFCREKSFHAAGKNQESDFAPPP